MTRFSSKKNNNKDKKEDLGEISSTELPSSSTSTNEPNFNDDMRPRKPSIFTVEKLNERYHLNQDFDESPLSGTWNYIKKYYKPTPAFFKRQLFKRIPFIEWIQHYNLKEWLVSDIVSGLTIGIVHIPQGKKTVLIIL